MLTPAYRLTLGENVVDTTAEPRASTLVALRVSLDLETPADEAVLVLGAVGDGPPERGERVVVELGYAGDDLVTVLTGTVVAVNSGLLTSRVVVHGGGSALLRATAERTCESMTAGDIVRDLAGSAGTPIGAVTAGITFPAYVIDGRRSLAAHLRDLADLCGFDVYLDPAGSLYFQPFAGGAAVHGYDYARHILELAVERTEAAAGSVQAWGDSPGTSRGSQSWAWLTKDFSGSAGRHGSATPALLLERPALRTADAASAAAEALAADIGRRTVRGRLLGVGRPEVRLGDAIRLRDVPDDPANGTYQVRAATHLLSKRRGFRTEVAFRAERAEDPS